MRIKGMVLISVVILLILILITLTIHFSINLNDSDNENTIYIDENDNGTNLIAEPGTYINIQLKENPSTGYKWNFSKTDGLEIVNNRFYFEKNIDSKNINEGQPGIREWVLLLNDDDFQFFNAEYERSWENESISVFKIYINDKSN